jgi:hypothetical protein
VEIETILEFEKQGYCKYMSNKFGFHDGKGNYKYTILEEEEKGDDLKAYLDSIVGQSLYKKDQEELKEAFKENGLIARTLGINTLNGNLKDRKMPFTIEIGERKSFRDKEGKIKKDKSHWIIGKIIYN